MRPRGSAAQGLPGYGDFGPHGGAFQAEGPAAAGGFYRLEVRLLLQGEQVAETSVAHVGVGGVFVTAGLAGARQAMGEEGGASIGPVERPPA